MKKKTKVILVAVFIFCFIVIGTSNSNDTINENDTTQPQKDVPEREEQKQKERETDIYGWTTNDYEEFSIALKLIANNYLTDYKLPLYNKWQFAKFDDEGRIFAMTNELTFKGDHEKHLIICIFSLSGDIKENGLHEKINWNYFGTDEKTYYDDGSCDDVFEKFLK